MRPNFSWPTLLHVHVRCRLHTVDRRIALHFFVPGFVHSSVSLTLHLVSDLPGSSPPRLNPLAPSDMIGIHGGLAFDTAVPIQMASAAALGGNPELVGTVRICAGLRGPVAWGANKRWYVFTRFGWVPDGAEDKFRQRTSASVIQAVVAGVQVAVRAVRIFICILSQIFHNSDDILFGKGTCGLFCHSSLEQGHCIRANIGPGLFLSTGMTSALPTMAAI
jgi:hypothetical protein